MSSFNENCTTFNLYLLKLLKQLHEITKNDTYINLYKKINMLVLLKTNIIYTLIIKYNKEHMDKFKEITSYIHKRDVESIKKYTSDRVDEKQYEQLNLFSSEDEVKKLLTIAFQDWNILSEKNKQSIWEYMKLFMLLINTDMHV